MHIIYAKTSSMAFKVNKKNHLQIKFMNFDKKVVDQKTGEEVNQVSAMTLSHGEIIALAEVFRGTVHGTEIGRANKKMTVTLNDDGSFYISHKEYVEKEQTFGIGMKVSKNDALALSYALYEWSKHNIIQSFMNSEIPDVEKED